MFAPLPPGGEIVLSLKGENGRQIITLQDNGPGIAPENQQRIFEPFYTSKSRGTGLGLAIVKGCDSKKLPGGNSHRNT